MAEALTELEWWEMVYEFYSTAADDMPSNKYSNLANRMSFDQEDEWYDDAAWPLLEGPSLSRHRATMRRKAQRHIDRINLAVRLADGAMIASMIDGQ